MLACKKTLWLFLLLAACLFLCGTSAFAVEKGTPGVNRSMMIVMAVLVIAISNSPAKAGTASWF